ncbi:MAG: hypothetical protein DME22_05550 [Verrucomicrobia bacterium]|nr:MAG: hypothetical protein DME22_05550 [Verrucomicrobiota bacterium]PYK00845.1 MAG: hypothetical protein DME23_06020 [Verrucomicrobiota bacterium]
MLREEIKHLKTGPRELRKFGFTVGAIFILLGVWFLWRGKARYPYFLAPGILLIVLGAATPGVLRLIYIGWMSLAFLLGFVVSNILLTLFFYLVVTPIGLVARLAGKDFLNRRFDAQTKSYWIMRDRSSPEQKKNYEQQF